MGGPYRDVRPDLTHAVMSTWNLSTAGKRRRERRAGLWSVAGRSRQGAGGVASDDQRDRDRPLPALLPLAIALGRYFDERRGDVQTQTENDDLMNNWSVQVTGCSPSPPRHGASLGAEGFEAALPLGLLLAFTHRVHFGRRRSNPRGDERHRRRAGAVALPAGSRPIAGTGDVVRAAGLVAGDRRQGDPNETLALLCAIFGATFVVASSFVVLERAERANSSRAGRSSPGNSKLLEFSPGRRGRCRRRSGAP